MEAAGSAGIDGIDLTPFVLQRLHLDTKGRTLAAHARLVGDNAELAGADRQRLLHALTPSPRGLSTYRRPKPTTTSRPAALIAGEYLPSWNCHTSRPLPGL